MQKDKLVVLHAGAVVYFDGTDHTSDANLAAKVISLAACHVRRSDPEGGAGVFGLRGPGREFTLVTPSRDFVFGAAEADAWVAAIQAEIDAGAALAAEHAGAFKVAA